MISKKSLIDNELMKEIITIRLDTLWRMLEQRRLGFMPAPEEEGATGKFDNKGAIFIPGGLIYQDVDERHIRYEPYGQITGAQFRGKIRQAMRRDNATLLYPDGIAIGINLDSGFFSKAARRILTFKKAAYRRTKKIGSNSTIEIGADDIIKSHCPTYMKPPYGARTRISTCASIGLIDPPMFFAYNKTELNFSAKQSQRFLQDIDRTREDALSADGNILYPPYIVVCHDTRYRENNFTGLTRILGIGKFGEFATFSFEAMTKQLAAEIIRKKQQCRPEDVFATCDDLPVLGVLRVYQRTNPAKRSLKYLLYLVSPAEDIAIDLDLAKQAADCRYCLNLDEPADTLELTAQGTADSSCA